MANEEIISITGVHQFTLYDKDGFQVVKFRDEETGKIFTACGNAIPCTKDCRAILHGRWTERKRKQDGEVQKQFSVQFSEIQMPVSERGVVSYLRSLKVKGLGKKKATLIYEAFGNQIWDILENDPDRVKSIKGINEKIATGLIKKLGETQALRRIMHAFKGRCDITLLKAKAVLDTFQDDAICVVETQPYRLCQVRGFSFQAVDAMAMSMGIPPDDENRVYAALFHLCREHMTSGHVCVPLNELCKLMQRALRYNNTAVPLEVCQAAIKKAHSNGSLHYQAGMVYLKAQFEQEKYIAATIKNLVSRDSAIDNIDVFLAQYQKETGIILADKQADAVRCCLRNSMSVITGGPGTGKTTTIRALLYVHKLVYGNASEPVLLAPTGRAARRMSEATGYPASTIHSAIGYTEQTGNPQACTRLEGNLVIVDETSMMDQLIAYLLLSSLPENARLVFVGDPDQLPSVGCGNILHDIIVSGVVPLTKLDVIYRQGENSPVITNAHAINTGNTELVYAKGFRFIERNDTASIFEKACSFYVQCVNCYGIDNVVLLNPYRSKTALSVNEFNKHLQEVVNPLKAGDFSITVHGTEFRTNDKVMQTKNTEIAKNGDIGYIRRIARKPAEDDPTEFVYTAFVEFNGDGIEHPYSEDALVNVDLAYCSTIHKSQGSQYETVIMVLSNEHSLALKRNLVYTGVTRAEKNVALIGQSSALRKAILNNTADIRYTLLPNRLRSA